MEPEEDNTEAPIDSDLELLEELENQLAEVQKTLESLDEGDNKNV